MESTENKTIVVTITPEMHQALLELAPQHGATVAGLTRACLLYTSDAADERSSVDLGGRRIIKKKKKNKLLETAHE